MGKPLLKSEKRTLVSQRKRNTFLKCLAVNGRPVQAAIAAGYKSTSAVNALRRSDPKFAEDYDAAIECAMDLLEDEAMRRACEGVLVPQYYQGRVVGYKYDYSDALLMFLLKGGRPDKFRENVKVDANIEGNMGITVLPMTAPSEEDWEQHAIQLHRRVDGSYGAEEKKAAGTEVVRAD